MQGLSFIIPDTLVAASLLVGAYQDARRRAVQNWVWIPAVVGDVLGFLLTQNALSLYLMITASKSVVMLAAVAFEYSAGMIKAGDVIAFALICLAPGILYFFLTLLFGTMLALAYSLFKRRTTALPFVSYFGIGFLLAALVTIA